HHDTGTGIHVRRTDDRAGEVDLALTVKRDIVDAHRRDVALAGGPEKLAPFHTVRGIGISRPLIEQRDEALLRAGDHVRPPTQIQTNLIARGEQHMAIGRHRDTWLGGPGLARGYIDIAKCTGRRKRPDKSRETMVSGDGNGPTDGTGAEIRP